MDEQKLTVKEYRQYCNGYKDGREAEAIRDKDYYDTRISSGTAIFYTASMIVMFIAGFIVCVGMMDFLGMFGVRG